MVISLFGTTVYMLCFSTIIAFAVSESDYSWQAEVKVSRLINNAERTLLHPPPPPIPRQVLLLLISVGVLLILVHCILV